MIDEKSDSRIDGIFEIKMARNFKKGIKGRIIILLMLGVSNVSIVIINGFRSPETLRNTRNWVQKDSNYIKQDLQTPKFCMVGCMLIW